MPSGDCAQPGAERRRRLSRQFEIVEAVQLGEYCMMAHRGQPIPTNLGHGGPH